MLLAYKDRALFEEGIGSPPQIEISIHEFRKHLMIPSFQCFSSSFCKCRNLFHICPNPRVPFQPPLLHRAMYLQQTSSFANSSNGKKAPVRGAGPCLLYIVSRKVQRSAFRSSAPSRRSRVSQDFRRPLQSLRPYHCCNEERKTGGILLFVNPRPEHARLPHQVFSRDSANMLFELRLTQCIPKACAPCT
jgi:hypothetical protein